MNAVNYVCFTLPANSIRYNTILEEMCKVIISLICSHVLEYVIHQISAQIDFIDLKITFYICFILPGFFSLCVWNIIISRCTSHFPNTFPPSRKICLLFYHPYWWQVLPTHLLIGAFCAICFNPALILRHQRVSQTAQGVIAPAHPTELQSEAQRTSTASLKAPEQGSKQHSPCSIQLQQAGCSYCFTTTQTYWGHKKQWKQGPTAFWEDQNHTFGVSQQVPKHNHCSSLHFYCSGQWKL